MYRRGLNYLRENLLRDEEGSISVLTIGLFIVLLTLSMILTDISSIYLAKRELTLATEAALQRGMKNLDAKSYYSGEYNLTQLLQNSLGGSEGDPGIPIDCAAGLRDAQEMLDDGSVRANGLLRPNMNSVALSDFRCDGFQIYLESSAKASLPIPIPFIDISVVSINSYAGAIGERAQTNNFYGFDIG
jgi:hypothetical protein